MPSADALVNKTVNDVKTAVKSGDHNFSQAGQDLNQILQRDGNSTARYHNDLAAVNAGLKNVLPAMQITGLDSSGQVLVADNSGKTVRLETTPLSSSVSSTFNASQHLTRIGQVNGDNGQPNLAQYNGDYSLWQKWAYDVCSTASMTEVMNAYGAQINGHPLTIADTLKYQLQAGAIDPKNGLLSHQGINDTVSLMGFQSTDLSQVTTFGQVNVDTIVNEANSGKPVMVGLRKDLSHWMVVVGGNANDVIVADSSLHNWHTLSRSEFASMWDGTDAVVITPKDGTALTPPSLTPTDSGTPLSTPVTPTDNGSAIQTGGGQQFVPSNNFPVATSDNSGQFTSGQNTDSGSNVSNSQPVDNPNFDAYSAISNAIGANAATAPAIDGWISALGPLAGLSGAALIAELELLVREGLIPASLAQALEKNPKLLQTMQNPQFKQWVDSPQFKSMKAIGNPMNYFLTEFDTKWNPNGPTSNAQNCGQSSLAMIYAHFTGQNITPGNAQKFIDQVSAATGQSGPTGASDLVNGAHNLHLSASAQQGIGAIDTALAQGKMVVASGDPLAYDTKYGVAGYSGGTGPDGVYAGRHWIAVVGKDPSNGNYIVNDPAYRNNNGSPIELTQQELEDYLTKYRQQDGGFGNDVVVVGPPGT